MSEEISRIPAPGTETGNKNKRRRLQGKKVWAVTKIAIATAIAAGFAILRSEERRVGKECL